MSSANALERNVSKEEGYSTATSRAFPTQEIFAEKKHATEETKASNGDVELASSPTVNDVGYHRALGRRQIMMVS